MFISKEFEIVRAVMLSNDVTEPVLLIFLSLVAAKRSFVQYTANGLNAYTQ